jgi:hypothetical protein
MWGLSDILDLSSLIINSDRQKLIKEKPVIPPPADDDEDEYDDMYA